MDNIADNKDYARLFDNSPVSARMGVVVVSLGRLLDKTGYYCRDRVRNDYLLLLTLDGKAWVREGKRKKLLGKGSWFLLRPGIVHSYRDVTPWSFLYVHFHGGTADQVINGLSFFKRENLGFGQSGNEAKELLSRLVASANDVTMPGEILRNAVLLELLTCLHSNYRNNQSGYEPLVKAYEYIADNLDRELELPRLAEITGVSQFHLVRIFKEKYGYPPIRFMQKLRIEKAKELLRREPGSRKIYEIAELSGFKDPLYFSKVFSKWTGMSPEKFRIYAKRPDPAGQ
ncbi:MAG: AraC family transcriptional regulator [Victivallaceae bacterium]|jgi:AraC-like DNA-binding protein